MGCGCGGVKKFTKAKTVIRSAPIQIIKSPTKPTIRSIPVRKRV